MPKIIPNLKEAKERAKKAIKNGDINELKAIYNQYSFEESIKGEVEKETTFHHDGTITKTYATEEHLSTIYSLNPPEIRAELFHYALQQDCKIPEIYNFLYNHDNAVLDRLANTIKEENIILKLIDNKKPSPPEFFLLRNLLKSSNKQDIFKQFITKYLEDTNNNAVRRILSDSDHNTEFEKHIINHLVNNSEMQPSDYLGSPHSLKIDAKNKEKLFKGAFKKNNFKMASHLIQSGYSPSVAEFKIYIRIRNEDLNVNQKKLLNKLSQLEILKDTLPNHSAHIDKIIKNFQKDIDENLDQPQRINIENYLITNSHSIILSADNFENYIKERIKPENYENSPYKDIVNKTNQLYTKAQNLKDKYGKHGNAYNSAKTLVSNMQKHINRYIENKNIQQFEVNSKGSIKTANKVLGKNRGFKKVLNGLLTAVTGFVFNIFKKVTTGSFFFKSSSAQKTSKLKKALQDFKKSKEKEKENTEENTEGPKQR